MSYSSGLIRPDGAKKEDRYLNLYRHSVDDPESFWAEQAQRIHWHVQPQRILEASNPPFRQWFVGGQTNLCFNALDRHLPERAEQLALVAVSSETGVTQEITYAQLYREVNTFAAVLKRLNVEKGDRVVIYMPNMAEAVFAMLACARIGAIHSVVFGGFAARNLSARIDDSQPKLLITADAGMRGGRVIPYKPLVDQACAESESPPPKVLIVSRGLQPELTWVPGRDEDYATLRAAVGDAQVSVEWLESNDPSYLLYTSGTTGKPKGVQRDVGGYAVALALSMETVFDVAPGQVMFSTSDVGWAVGHSYNVYGPLIVGATSLLYEGLPTHPDAGIWWSLCERYAVRTMFSSPTAVRVLKRFNTDAIARHDLNALRYLFLAGEPLDEPTANWISRALGKPVIDNYWQTETGWPAITLHPGLEMKPVKLGSAGLPNLGYRIKVIDELSGAPVAAHQKGMLVVEPPLPPGFMTTIWRDDDRFCSSYFGHFKEQVYSSLDWAVQDEDGYTYILGRTDDVINVAGHRLGTREIEESAAEASRVAEAAVIGVPDEIKGQVPVAFVTLRKTASDELQRREAAAEIRQAVESRLGAVARPARVYIVNLLPKTRSGKLLRRSLQALALQADPGDLSTLDDPSALDEIRHALRRGPDAGN
ncbi:MULTISPECIES: propionate--CoA ligase [Pseudomonas]|jgi:propionyl-CoA synthetase|uniref:Propionate--CoA ligase n=4 Tax=Pseudomonas putida group TaxID=136845 RepID=O33459_PSEPU|nr:MULTISPECIES: propionate--CoA ligase [Pseudomonas]AAB62302.1 acetyl-coenzyme A synthetase [Pseudomonas putida]ABA10792.1 acetyl-coenzyme A synthetase [Pseudomonas putida]ADI95381.1 CymE [Pseudomonas putida DOT-T1E]AFO50075.1 Propionate--CoA ligase [Pseudomonas putida DOT-T1E]AHC82441.1 acetyl-CoA synthetase [Pseudomonas monteilii SB3078]